MRNSAIKSNYDQVKSLTKTSKFLSFILRHKPEVIGINLDEHGWADVNDLTAGMGITLPAGRSVMLPAKDWLQKIVY